MKMSTVSASTNCCFHFESRQDSSAMVLLSKLSVDVSDTSVAGKLWYIGPASYMMYVGDLLEYFSQKTKRAKMIIACRTRKINILTSQLAFLTISRNQIYQVSN
jgi:hypothetical protein